MDWFVDLFQVVQNWIFEVLLQPVMFWLGLGGRLEEGFAATAWFLVGCLQLAVMVLIMVPLEKRWPVEPVSDRPAIRVDMLYTLIHRLGLFRLALFFSIDPLTDVLFAWWRGEGYATWHLDEVWPGVTDVAWVSLLLYLVVFDALHYAIHRAQHQFSWWWELHALHHSQRQMTLWSDNRNHLLDDILVDVIVVVVAQGIGIAPSQFVAVVAITQLCENLQHANLRLWFGKVGERLLVSPRFHRMHHAIGIGHESHRGGKVVLGGCNFGVLFPWWDMLFRTANFELRYEPTGVRDQIELGVDYGKGFWAQQWLGVCRLFGKSRASS